MYIGLHVKYPLFFSDFNLKKKLNFLDTFSKVPEYKISLKSVPFYGPSMFHADRQTDRHEALKVAFFSQLCERT